MIQEIKDHQVVISNSLKEELTISLMQTLHVFSLLEDQENHNPNTNVVPEYQMLRQT